MRDPWGGEPESTDGGPGREPAGPGRGAAEDLVRVDARDPWTAQEQVGGGPGPVRDPAGDAGRAAWRWAGTTSAAPGDAPPAPEPRAAEPEPYGGWRPSGGPPAGTRPPAGPVPPAGPLPGTGPRRADGPPSFASGRRQPGAAPYGADAPYGTGPRSGPPYPGAAPYVSGPQPSTGPPYAPYAPGAAAPGERSYGVPAHQPVAEHRAPAAPTGGGRAVAVPPHAPCGGTGAAGAEPAGPCGDRCAAHGVRHRAVPLDTVGAPDAQRPGPVAPASERRHRAATRTCGLGRGRPHRRVSSGAPRHRAARPAHSRQAGPRTASGRFLARAAAVTAALTAAGALLGLVRDQILARFFGAGAETDAFLIAWTVPEFASTLLIEDAMALILVPAFSRALARRGGLLSGDPVRALVRSTLPRLALTVSAVSVLLIVAAPLLVGALAPGLPDPGLAIDCTRLTATCVLTFALAGYCSAALRAHGSFLPPAAIYVAYNVGIIGTILVLREPFGVRSAAAGVAVGGVLMVLVQAPSLLRELRARPLPKEAPAPTAGDGRLLALGLIAPVVAFALTRQSQILIERFLASPLPAGAISHLNYAQKVAQMPMILSLMLCTVSFPVVARAMAAGDVEEARRRVERDLLLAAVVVLVGASVVVAAAPQIVEILFQRGAFDRADTAATAAVMRVYALGLLGQTMVGALVRCYFSAARPLWYPAAAMAAGLLATAVAGVPCARLWGAAGIAAANALGITLTAVLLLCGARRQSIPVRIRRLGEGLLRLAVAAAVATGAGWLAALPVEPAVGSLAVAGLVATAVFLLLLACAPQAPDIPPLTRTASRRLAHDRCHGAPQRRDPSSAAEAAPVGGDVPLDRGRPG
ncbi:lipid II flippase MurJ [Streptomyces sp. NPDC085614]|uniref:lipid II flippase MurJ n=1 Tax=Streptomyces sp. NPDC085614 TaxID=3365733 RepID=UPI0037D9383E